MGDDQPKDLIGLKYGMHMEDWKQLGPVTALKFGSQVVFFDLKVTNAFDLLLWG